ncbi:hypothetical protein BDA99DRAFT_564077 [Phascolomyces articulosus]|uniref:Uncharacterized protein n=1 Tax=Phascolomyces articulosus TaxID=60185 RepID=A0AAD5P9P9_9FUNG|nr:hypothetical protein BDA99DRAFT_564077 [Phascolomyces articulosus]
MRPTLEDAVINEARMFVDNISTLNHIVASTNDKQVTHLIHKLRLIEQRLSLIYTFFMASSYSNTKRKQEGESHHTNRPPFL